MDRMSAAIQGARICVAHWTTDGDTELIADATERLERLQQAARGETPERWAACPEARDVDIDGALDWLDRAEDEAIDGLIAAWDDMVDGDDTYETELAGALMERLDGSVQGWDSSMEDAEAYPELAALVGLAPMQVVGPDVEAEAETDEDIERWNEAVEAWGRVVAEAARRWLGDHPEARAEALAGAIDPDED